MKYVFTFPRRWKYYIHLDYFKWDIFQMNDPNSAYFFLTSEFFTLAVRFPTLLLILRHWMSIVVQNSFYPSIYFSLYHPLGMIFYWMRKKIIQQQKIQINFSHISQYYMMNLYSKRSCIDKKPIFHCTRSLWVHPSHAIFLWFYYPMILIFDI